MTKLNLSEIIERERKIQNGFRLHHDKEPWTPEARYLDLGSTTGRLAQAILELKGFKPKGEAADKLSRELAIAFSLLLDIADEFDLDFESEVSDYLGEVESFLESSKG